jgi:hypothetical protein
LDLFWCSLSLSSLLSGPFGGIGRFQVVLLSSPPLLCEKVPELADLVVQPLSPFLQDICTSLLFFLGYLLLQFRAPPETFESVNLVALALLHSHPLFPAARLSRNSALNRFRLIDSKGRG